MWPFAASLGDLERAVMDVLWDSDGDLSVREVHERLGEQRDLAYTTVMTVLDRLAKKKVVTRSRDGRAWQYSPVGSREEMTAASMRNTLESLDSGDRKAAMLHFIGGASKEEIADLQALLEAASPKSSG
ncbi:MAG: BlaI/MecI/CopY family transcriptional regulator [Actinomycetales bacterium]|nr:BlaI/MecI/CopY family transcriptional regulator [Actinomycetales bacterium]